MKKASRDLRDAAKRLVAEVDRAEDRVKFMKAGNRKRRLAELPDPEA
jgi:hypothetical protein